MYDVAQAKRQAYIHFNRRADKWHSISRADLQGSDWSSEDEVDIKTIQRLKDIANLEYTDDAINRRSETPIADDGADAATAEQSVAFRLFAPTTGAQSTAPVQVIRLRSSTPEEQNNAGIASKPRPDTYYLAKPLDDALAAEYNASALNGAQVLSMAKAHCPGMVYQWKVIKADKDKTVGQATENKTRRTRPGKQARIKRRTRLAAAAAKRQKQVDETADKERQLREKRAKRNRDKKLKKRARDKLKKADGAAPASGEGNDNSNDNDDDDDDHAGSASS